MTKAARITNACRNNGYKEWFDCECKKQLEEPNNRSLRMFEDGTPEVREKYSQQRKRTKSIVREKKRRYHEYKLRTYRIQREINLLQG